MTDAMASMQVQVTLEALKPEMEEAEASEAVSVQPVRETALEEIPDYLLNPQMDMPVKNGRRGRLYRAVVAAGNFFGAAGDRPVELREPASGAVPVFRLCVYAQSGDSGAQLRGTFPGA